MAETGSDDHTVGSSDKAGYPERACPSAVTGRGCLQARSVSKPARRPSAFHTPSTPTPSLLSCYPRRNFGAGAGGSVGMVGWLPPGSVVRGPGSRRGPRTPNPAGLPPEQAIPGASLSLQTQASTECRHFPEISIFTLWERSIAQGLPNSSLHAPVKGGIILMGSQIVTLYFC